MRITPADLLALGAADAVLADPADAAGHLVALLDAPGRLAGRRERWSRPLPRVL
jgi:hypothetical protein